MIINQLYSTNSFEEKINRFIDKNLFGNSLEDDNTSSGFVFVRQYPVFNEQIIHKYNNVMTLCLTVTSKQCKIYKISFHK